jgi:hypothetical protein
MKRHGRLKGVLCVALMLILCIGIAIPVFAQSMATFSVISNNPDLGDVDYEIVDDEDGFLTILVWAEVRNSEYYLDGFEITSTDGTPVIYEDVIDDYAGFGTVLLTLPDSGHVQISAMFFEGGSHVPTYPVEIPTRPEHDIIVIVNGNTLYLDVPPFLVAGRTLVPLRAIFEALGAEVIWEPEIQEITAIRGETNIALMIGSNIMFRNGESSIIDVPPMILDGRTLVPTRVIAESFGAAVNWDAATSTVTITGNQ